jgi:exodeoxyribonuclease-3
VKVATYNVNGINGRLEVLLRWLEEASPDVLCLQELKAPQEKFPIKAIEGAGYGAIWQGQKSWNGVAILARGQEPHLTRKGLPGEPEDEHSRYIEAIVDGIVIGGLYLPNGNPYPGPKFDYKLRWFKRLRDFATTRQSCSSWKCQSSSSATTLCRPNSTSTSRNAGRTTRSSASK